MYCTLRYVHSPPSCVAADEPLCCTQVPDVVARLSFVQRCQWVSHRESVFSWQHGLTDQGQLWGHLSESDLLFIIVMNTLRIVFGSRLHHYTLPAICSNLKKEISCCIPRTNPIAGQWMISKPSGCSQHSGEPACGDICGSSDRCPSVCNDRTLILAQTGSAALAGSRGTTQRAMVHLLCLRLLAHPQDSVSRRHRRSVPAALG